jgi:YggT family protein
MLLTAATRNDVANYVSAVFEVYLIILLVYVLTNLIFALGVRPPYSRFTDAVLGFLRDVSEPYLRLFRKLLPPIGMIDFTPMIAIIVLGVVWRIVVSAIQG